LKLALASHVLMLGCLAGLCWTAELGWVFLIGVAVVAALLAYEHSLVRPDDLARVNLAFFHVNAVISVGLLVVALADIWVNS
jgi:4-hydroxybenzoate polyprenyltransferase